MIPHFAPYMKICHGFLTASVKFVRDKGKNPKLFNAYSCSTLTELGVER